MTTATMEPITQPITPADRDRFVAWISTLMTHSDVCRLFRKSELTIMLWRQNDGLPAIRIPGESRDTLRYERNAVMSWAKAKGKRVFIKPQS